MKIPRRWRRYEDRLRVKIYNWISTGRPTTLTQMAWDFAGSDVYNRGDGFVFMDFNERTQRLFLVPGYIDWVKELTKETELQLEQMRELMADRSKEWLTY